jgi:hypothetical protein
VNGSLAGQITVSIVDFLAGDSDRAEVLIGLGAAVVVELDRFGVTIDQFAESLRMLKSGRDAELARQASEN